MLKKLFIVSVFLLNGCAYQFICGDGNTTTQPKTVSPETQVSAPITGQGTASTGTANQTQNNQKGEVK